jgi:hypothetical protein
VGEKQEKDQSPAVSRRFSGHGKTNIASLFCQIPGNGHTSRDGGFELQLTDFSASVRLQSCASY